MAMAVSLSTNMSFFSTMLVRAGVEGRSAGAAGAAMAAIAYQETL